MSKWDTCDACHCSGVSLLVEIWCSISWMVSLNLVQAGIVGYLHMYNCATVDMFVGLVNL